MNKLTFPVPVEKISHYAPHRDTAIWIDEVLYADEKSGECALTLKEGAYMSDYLLRHSSFVEFVAQSYGYSTICRQVMDSKSQVQNISKVFLVGIKSFKINMRRDLTLGEKLVIKVQKKHELGPLAIIEGRVFSSLDLITPLAEGLVKIFSD